MVFHVSHGLALISVHLREQPLLQPFWTGFSGKDFHLMIAARALAGWDAVLGSCRVQWHSLCVDLLAEVNISVYCAGLLWPRLWRCWRQLQPGLFRSSEVKAAGSSCSPVLPLEEVPAKGIPLGTWSGQQALRAIVELEPWNQVYAELSQYLGLEA